MFGIGSQELLIIFLVVLLLFGADRIPEVAKALGKGIRDVKRAAGEFESEIQEISRQKDALIGKSKNSVQEPDSRRRPTAGPASSDEKTGGARDDDSAKGSRAPAEGGSRSPTTSASDGPKEAGPAHDDPPEADDPIPQKGD